MTKKLKEYKDSAVVFGIKAPGDPNSEERTIAYKIWFSVFWRIRTVRHWFKLHDYIWATALNQFYCSWCHHLKQKCPGGHCSRYH